MTKVRWQEIRSALRAADVAPEPPPRDVFWTAFRDRLALVPRTDRDVRPIRAAALPQWLAVAASVAIVATLLLLPLARDRNKVKGTVLARDPRPSGVEEIEVFVPCGSVMIMTDENTGGTIVWLVDLDVGADT